jgi:hypothetical protein
MTDKQIDELQTFLGNPYIVTLIKGTLLSFVRQFSDEQMDAIGDSSLHNEEIGAIMRANSTAIKLLESSFRELEKLKQVEVSKPPNENPAR